MISVQILLTIVGCVLLGLQGFSLPRDTGRFQMGWLGLFCLALTLVIGSGVL